MPFPPDQPRPPKPGLKSLTVVTLLSWPVISLATFLHEGFGRGMFDSAVLIYLVVNLMAMGDAIEKRTISTIVPIYLYACLNFLLLIPFMMYTTHLYEFK